MKYFSLLTLLCIVFMTICCFVSINGVPTDEEICQQPMLRGRCRALIPRFYYDSETGECTKFGFGGCGGNENNFESMEACEAKCKGT